MLKKPEPGGEREAYAPPRLQQTPPPPPPEPKPKPEAKQEPPPGAARNTEPAPPARASAPPPEPKLDPLAASLRAALAPEPDHASEHEHEHEANDVAHEERPARPEGLFFRSSPEEVTVSAPGTQPEMARATRPADEHDLDAMEQTFAPGMGDELLRTSEGAALDFLDSTLARPPKLAEHSPVGSDTGENPIASLDDASAGGDEDFEEEVIIADDLAEMIDGEEEAGPATEESPPEEAKSKRSVPPPIPRQ